MKTIREDAGGALLTQVMMMDDPNSAGQVINGHGPAPIAHRLLNSQCTRLQPEKKYPDTLEN